MPRRVQTLLLDTEKLKRKRFRIWRKVSISTAGGNSIGMSRMEHGIYFDLPEAKYHAVDALSKSLIHAFRVCPRDAFLMLTEPREPTDAMIYGSAVHKWVLEGEVAFKANYTKAFSPQEFPEALKTCEDLTTFIELKGGKAKGKKSDLISEAKRLDPDVQILDELKNFHDSTSRGKVQLSAESYDRITELNVNGNDEFSEGEVFNEVSFFWYDETLGCECKARLDRITCYAGTTVIWDVKTFSNFRRKEIVNAVHSEINHRKYWIDLAFYRQALLGTPTTVDVPWCDNIETRLLFIESCKHPNIIPVDLPLEEMGALTVAGGIADTTIRAVATEINGFQKTNGLNTPWGTTHDQTYFNEEHLHLSSL